MEAGEMIDTPEKAPLLTHLCRLDVKVTPVVSLGNAPCGERRFVPIVGGTAQGTVLSGEILAGGVDWQLQRPDGTLDIAAHYVIRADDGALIEVRSNGYRHGPAEVMARLNRGDAVAPDEYYFHTGITFQTGASRWQHLNSVLAIGKGIREAYAVFVDVYQVG